MPGKNVLNGILKSIKSEFYKYGGEWVSIGLPLAATTSGKMPPADKMSPVYLEEGLEKYD